MHRFSPIRAAVTMIIICIALAGLIGRVAYLQTYGREHTIRSAERQQHVTETL
jgi:cell division protein FtsI/penicillin-binding protein 2